MLKLKRSHNAYDTLGLPWSATTTQVRTRYRQLVRGHRKELSPTHLLADEQFREWANAYLLLTSPERKEYDRRLRQSRGREQPADSVSQLPESARLLLYAEAAFMQRKLNEAVELAKSAVKLESRNAAGYALLGDILREQSKYANALTMYNYAIQFDPNNRRYWQGLEEVQALRDGKALPRRFSAEARHPLRRPLWVWFVAGLTVIGAELAIFLMRDRWGEPGFLNLPTNLIYTALGVGFVVAAVLAATAILAPFDDEFLWYQVPGIGAETVPIGLFIGVPGIAFFWVAPIFYAIVALLDEHVSASIVTALALCGLIAVALSFLVPQEHQLTVRLLSGNFAFAGFMAGWLIGSIRRRVFEH